MIKFGSNYASKIQHLYSCKPFSLAIIGSGPAGLYTAKHLLNDIENINIHVFEKDICPTGLIRYGMAPDHQRIKGVANELLSIMSHNSCHYFGGVQIGKDIKINELEQMYSAIFYAFGASQSKLLNVPGESNQMVYSAHEIVNWYNSHPKYFQLNINFTNIRNIAIIGNGNVSLDIARIFGLTQDELERTDINPDSIEKLRGQKINNIIIIGRRGLVQSQFTLKELRELSKLPQFRLLLYKPDILRSLNEQSETECKDIGINYSNVTRANRRKLEFIRNFEIIEDEETLASILSKRNEDGRVKIIFRFLLSPLEIQTQEPNNLTLKLQSNQLIGKSFKQKAQGVEEYSELKCNMIIKSIGYQSENISNDISWDERNNIIDNSDGCVKLDKQKLQVGQYACGWIKTGPKGVIDSTFASSQETIVNFKNHLEAELIQPLPDPHSQVTQLLNRRSIGFIGFDVWNRINQFELQKGREQNKPRVKLMYPTDFLNFL